MLDRNTFLKPIAHRGLHDARAGRIENSVPAFAAAIAKGYAIECDLRPAKGGLPIVFHDETLDRLIDGTGSVAALHENDLAGLRFKGGGRGILTFSGLLAMVAGRVPLFVEIKSEWEPPDADFLARICGLAGDYCGPLAMMSFDPAVMIEVKKRAPGIPRGIVAGLYEGDGWWRERLDEERAYRLSHLLESGAVAPDFIAYHVKALPTPVTRFVREVLGLPLVAWTVRTPEDCAKARRWADAAIFEGFEP